MTPDSRNDSAPGGVTLSVWTLQDRSVSRTLRSDRSHAMSWDRVAEYDREKFRAMAAVMEEAGVRLDGFAPVWGWTGVESVRSVGVDLLSEFQIEAGIDVITLDVPADLVVCTDYEFWCDVYFGDVSLDDWRAAHPVLPYAVGVQVTLPLVRSEWVRGVQPFR